MSASPFSTFFCHVARFVGVLLSPCSFGPVFEFIGAGFSPALRSVLDRRGGSSDPPAFPVAQALSL
jgi:hypothetical protein